MSNQSQPCFSIIDLAIVFAIAGMIAAAVVPNVLIHKKELQILETNRVGHLLTDATTENYAKRQKNNSAGRKISNCTDAQFLLNRNTLEHYSVVPLAIPVDKVVICSLMGPQATQSQFFAKGID